MFVHPKVNPLRVWNKYGHHTHLAWWGGRVRPPFFSNDEVLRKDILSLTLTLGWKNKKQPSGPIELDLEAGNLVQNNFCFLLNSIHNGFWVLGLKLADKQSQLPASCKFHVQSLRSYTILFLLTPPQLELDSEAAPTCLTINFYDIALSV